jgi:hypothetical protein
MIMAVNEIGQARLDGSEIAVEPAQATGYAFTAARPTR